MPCAAQILEADIVLWSAGQAPVTKAPAADPQHQIALPFGTNTRGAMQTDATLRVLRHQRVFALGDVAVRCVAWQAGSYCVVWLGKLQLDMLVMPCSSAPEADPLPVAPSGSLLQRRWPRAAPAAGHCAGGIPAG